MKLKNANYKLQIANWAVRGESLSHASVIKGEVAQV